MQQQQRIQQIERIFISRHKIDIYGAIQPHSDDVDVDGDVDDDHADDDVQAPSAVNQIENPPGFNFQLKANPELKLQ